jgi:hypothetical protein
MPQCNYSDENLIAIEAHLFLLVHGHQPERGERAQISNRIRFNQNAAKVKDLASVRLYFYQQYHRWPSAQEYDRLLSQLKARTTIMERPDHHA